MYFEDEGAAGFLSCFHCHQMFGLNLKVFEYSLKPEVTHYDKTNMRLQTEAYFLMYAYLFYFLSHNRDRTMCVCVRVLEFDLSSA